MSVPDPEIEWRVSPGLTPYPDALAEMEARASAIAEGRARELIWLLEHPPLYTAGTSAVAAELLDPRFPVYRTGRGGRHTYHGPGQRIGYVMIDLGRRGRDVRRFVAGLEQWLIDTLGLLGVNCFAAPGRVGIWTLQNGKEVKIGAIGVRVRRWVTLHGFAVNIAPDLSHFGGIVPCGLPDFGVASMKSLGKDGNFAAFDAALASRLGPFVESVSLSTENEA